jgi:hypothetical protein
MLIQQRLGSSRDARSAHMVRPHAPWRTHNIPRQCARRVQTRGRRTFSTNGATHRGCGRQPISLLESVQPGESCWTASIAISTGQWSNRLTSLSAAVQLDGYGARTHLRRLESDHCGGRGVDQEAGHRWCAEGRDSIDNAGSGTAPRYAPASSEEIAPAGKRPSAGISVTGTAVLGGTVLRYVRP